jgi:hypothetical protein
VLTDGTLTVNVRHIVVRKAFDRPTWSARRYEVERMAETEAIHDPGGRCCDDIRTKDGFGPGRCRV